MAPSNSGSRWLPFVLVLIAGIALGLLFRSFGGSGLTGSTSSTVAPTPTPRPAIQNLKVGPTPDVIQAQDLILHLSCMDSVIWTASDTTAFRNLYIDFDNDIFANDTPNGAKYRVPCAATTCTSGPLKTSTYGPYKYSQTLVDNSGRTTVADGRIIIQW